MDRGPKWDLESIYRGFESQEFKTDCEKISDLSERVIAYSHAVEPSPQWLEQMISTLDELYDLYEHLISYGYARFSVNTKDAEASAGLQKIEHLGLSVKRAKKAASRALSGLGEQVDTWCTQKSELRKYRFVISELREDARFMMSEEQEDLAADLQRSGADAWGRLQEAVSSTSDALWDEQTGERKSITQLRALAFDADRAVRERAFKKEIEVWKANETPLSYALNGVKGFSIAVDSRRGYEQSLDYAIRLSRITPEALSALMSVIEDSKPMFERYFSLKAKALGLKTLAFYDLFAPVGTGHQKWDFDQASSFIIEQFSAFDPQMGAFAQEAFRKHWIDAPPSEGKVGGAYCTHFPVTRESRILCNFEGSFSDLSTVAHELGHAYHGEVIADMPGMLKAYPMTLAETASIFSETIIFHKALELSQSSQRLGMIEGYLQDASQVIIDIYSRFLFENELFARRKQRDLSAGELCEIMEHSQIQAYGSGLDRDKLHRYMWAVKGHYYSSDLPFYNFPYAFGLLFALGLYARYREDPQQFPQQYVEMLRMTGSRPALEVAAAAGCNIESRSFWQNGIDEIGSLIDEFERLLN
jgi:pepF/M3 family oligoendopeptidase